AAVSSSPHAATDSAKAASTASALRRLVVWIMGSPTGWLGAARRRRGWVRWSARRARSARAGEGGLRLGGTVVGGAEVRLDDRRVGSHLLWRALGDHHAEVEDGDAIAGRHDEGHVVLDDE